jgi:hypothetical protein
MNKNKIIRFFPLLFLSLISIHCLNNTNIPEDRQPTTNPESAEKTLASFRKVNNYPIYSMKYDGSYGFEDYINFKSLTRRTIFPEQDKKVNWGCTCFAAMGKNDGMTFGRNFDWSDCLPLILYCHPPNGFASISIVDLEYMGFNRNHLPENTADKKGLLRSPFLPFDGMNEKGVAIAMMAISNANGPYDPNKKTIKELEVIRLVLDYAENTEKAISLIQQFNVKFTSQPIHYLIADKTGHSAIIEFIDGAMRVLQNPEPWQVSTNFIVYGSNAPNNVSCWRYNAVYSRLKILNGISDSKSSMKMLQEASQTNGTLGTIWSSVYDLNNNTINFVVGRNYNDIISFSFKDFE